MIIGFKEDSRIQGLGADKDILLAVMEGQEYKGYIFLSGVGALLILVIAVYKYCGKKYERCCCRRPMIYAEEEEQQPLLL